ncbi:MAG: glycosyltransferase family 9 protein, partial [Gammaproteobacteria bacterium]
LAGLAGVLAHARGVIGVDTGLAHLAAALSAPAVTIYGATSPELTGTVGSNQAHLCAEFACAPCGGRICTYHGEAEVQPACYQTIPPAKVWDTMTPLLEGSRQ